MSFFKESELTIVDLYSDMQEHVIGQIVKTIDSGHNTKNISKEDAKIKKYIMLKLQSDRKNRPERKCAILSIETQKWDTNKRI